MSVKLVCDAEMVPIFFGLGSVGLPPRQMVYSVTVTPDCGTGGCQLKMTELADPRVARQRKGKSFSGEIKGEKTPPEESPRAGQSELEQ